MKINITSNKRIRIDDDGRYGVYNADDDGGVSDDFDDDDDDDDDNDDEGLESILIYSTTWKRELDLLIFRHLFKVFHHIVHQKSFFAI